MKALEEIQQRKLLLVNRAARQREELAMECAVLERPLLMGRQASSVLKSPLVLLGISALLLKTPWRRFAHLPKWLWKGWQLFRLVRGFASLRF